MMPVAQIIRKLKTFDLIVPLYVAGIWKKRRISRRRKYFLIATY